MQKLKDFKYKYEAIYFAIILLVCFFLYFPTLSGGAFWDDYVLLFLPYLDENRNPLSFWIPGHKLFKTWPMFFTYIWVLKDIFGKNYFIFHLSSIFLHSINTFLVYINIKKYLNKHAELLSLYFLVHPVHLLTVSWIIQTKTLLLIMFTLLGILFFEKIWMFALFIFLAITSKLVAFTVIPFVFWGDMKERKLNVKILIVLFSIGVILSFFILYNFNSNRFSIYTLLIYKLPERIYVSIFNYVRYVKALFIPLDLSLFQPNTIPELSLQSFLYISAFVTSLTYLVYYSWNKLHFRYGFLFFTINILPLCGFFFIPIFYVTNFSEYWLSFPLLGILLIWWSYLDKKWVRYFMMASMLVNFIWVYREAGKLTNIEAFFERSATLDKKYGHELKLVALAQHYTYVGKCEKAEFIFKEIEKVENISVFCIPSKIETCYRNKWRMKHEKN